MNELEGKKNGDRTDTGQEIRKEKVKSERRIQLTDRDLDILEFVLEMSFSDLESIYRKFFFQLKSGEKSVSEFWARERVGLLKKHGYLKERRISFQGAAYYLTTDLGVLALRSMRGHKDYLHALSEIDIRYFEHDRLVLKSRIALEDSGRATSWISDRTLKTDTSLIKGLPRDVRPDGIYTNRSGEPVAFELERTRKAPTEYSIKIDKFVRVIRSDDTNSGFKRVLFSTCRDVIYRHLKERTAVYSELFKVVRSEELLSPGESSSVNPEVPK